MASNSEMRVAQKDKLYDLLKIKADNKDIEIKGLKEAIVKAKSVMEAEDVAYVEKMIAELY